SGKEILTVKGLSAGYGAVKVLSDINLTVEDRGITALLGANGAGKTTTLRAISNIVTQSKGAIELLGQRIDGIAPEKIVRFGIAHVPDGRGTFADLTVHENLLLGGYLRKKQDTQREIDRMYTYFRRLAERRTSK